MAAVRVHCETTPLLHKGDDTQQKRRRLSCLSYRTLAKLSGGAILCASLLVLTPGVHFSMPWFLTTDVPTNSPLLMAIQPKEIEPESNVREQSADNGERKNLSTNQCSLCPLSLSLSLTSDCLVSLSYIFGLCLCSRSLSFFSCLCLMHSLKIELTRTRTRTRTLIQTLLTLTATNYPVS